MHASRGHARAARSRQICHRLSHQRLAVADEPVEGDGSRAGEDYAAFRAYHTSEPYGAGYSLILVLVLVLALMMLMLASAAAVGIVLLCPAAPVRA